MHKVEKPIASLICVYNDSRQFLEMKASAKKLVANIEVIGIDNTKRRYQSAASALNAGIQMASADTFVHFHPDVEFINNLYLLRMIAAIEVTNSVVGVTGVSSNKHNRIVVSSIRENTGANRFSHDTINGDIQMVFIVNEWFLVAKGVNINKSLLMRWCLADGIFMWLISALLLKKKGINSFVVKSEVWHKPSGTLDSSFYRNERKLVKKSIQAYIRIFLQSVSDFPQGGFYALFCDSS